MFKLKQIAKKYQFANSLYGYFIGIVCVFSPKLSNEIRYRISTGEQLNLKNPKGFNEKLMWLNIYDKNPLKTKCADKLLVRDYVESVGLEKILTKHYYTYDKVEDIDWDKSPNKFVLKCTHGSGANVICENKNNLNIQEAKHVLKKGLRPRLLNTTAEMHYSDETNKIICEEYIDTQDGVLPNDYKIYCFNGEPKAILAMKDRDSKDGPSQMFYDLDWNPMKIYSNKETSRGRISRPVNLDEMIKYAKILSQDFSFVRVDLYDTVDRVYFGELTFTPAGCLSKAHSKEGDKYFGELLKLPNF